MKINRNKRKEIAEETLKVIKNGYYLFNGRRVRISKEISSMLSGTSLYRSEDFYMDSVKRVNKMLISVTAEKTFIAAKRLFDEGHKVCCLNFASAKNPGGGFLGGSQAQEECLARSSALYESLNSKFEYYEVNRANSSCIYTDNMIYSPDVPVFRDDNDNFLSEPFFTSVVTAPAVNMGIIKKREKQNVSKAQIRMKERIEKVLILCANKGEENLILGAWGCGVFQNDPEWMARSFFEVLNSKFFNGVFNQIVFAIPNESRRGEVNHKAFKKLWKY